MDNGAVDPEGSYRKIDGVDLILTEDSKHGPWPKIMLHRKKRETDAVTTGKNVWQ